MATSRTWSYGVLVSIVTANSSHRRITRIADIWPSHDINTMKFIHSHFKPVPVRRAHDNGGQIGKSVETHLTINTKGLQGRSISEMPTNRQSDSLQRDF